MSFLCPIDGLFYYKEEVVKSKRQKTSHSKIFEHLLFCLHKGKHNHMLWYSNADKTEFVVKMVNKKYPLWEEKDISLFKELDEVFDNRKRRKKKYDEETKGRFRSNMAKLKCYIKLKECVKDPESLCITYKTYEIISNSLGEVRTRKLKKLPKKPKKEMKNLGIGVNPVINISENEVKTKEVKTNFQDLSANMDSYAYDNIEFAVVNNSPDPFIVNNADESFYETGETQDPVLTSSPSAEYDEQALQHNEVHSNGSREDLKIEIEKIIERLLEDRPELEDYKRKSLLPPCSACEDQKLDCLEMSSTSMYPTPVGLLTYVRQHFLFPNEVENDRMRAESKNSAVTSNSKWQNIFESSDLDDWAERPMDFTN